MPIDPREAKLRAHASVDARFAEAPPELVGRLDGLAAVFSDLAHHLVDELPAEHRSDAMKYLYRAWSESRIAIQAGVPRVHVPASRSGGRVRQHDNPSAPDRDDDELARLAYEAFRAATGAHSSLPSDSLLPFDALDPKARNLWRRVGARLFEEGFRDGSLDAAMKFEKEEEARGRA